MIKLVWDNSFKRSYKKRVGHNNQLKKKFWETLGLFTSNPFDTRLKTHKLTGKLDGLWSFTIDYDCRIIFKFLKTAGEVLLIDIGTHDEVY